MKQFAQSGLCQNCDNNECATQAKSPTQAETQTPKIIIKASETSVEELLQEMNKKLAVIYKMEKQLQDISDAVDFYSEQYQALTEFKVSAEKKILALENKKSS